VEFPADRLRQGLRLAGGGIRVAEYDDTTALLENDGRTLRVTRSDDHAACVAETALAGQELLGGEEQMVLSLGVAEMLVPPTPEAAGNPVGGVHADALLLERVLAAERDAAAAVEIAATEDGQRVSTLAGTWHTLVPPPAKKLRAPNTLPFGASRLGGVAEAVKSTVVYAGSRKDGADQIVVTVADDRRVWLSRGGAAPGAVAGRQLSGEPPAGPGRRLLLRSELFPLLALAGPAAVCQVSVDDFGTIRVEVSTGGWNVRYSSAPDLAGLAVPPRVEEWLAAEVSLGCVVEAGRFASAVASACAMAGYSPPTATTRDLSAVAVPYEGAGEEKPAANKLVRFAFGPDPSAVVVASQGWRYDRTATPVGYLASPPPGQILDCFGAGTGEVTVDAKLIAAAAAAAGSNPGKMGLSLREHGNQTALVVQPSPELVYVLPINPELGEVG